MRFISFKYEGRASWGILENGGTIRDIGVDWSLGMPDLVSFLRRGKFDGVSALGRNEGITPPLVQFLPVVPNPGKIICVGLNYESHRLETGRPKEKYPVLFPRFAESQVGHLEPLIRPAAVSTDFDYEGEIAVVIGSPGYRIKEAQALKHVAGYACYNDGSVRDWQRHTHQFTPGKNFPGTGAFGPYLVTPDEVGDVAALKLTTRLNGEVVQSAGADEFLFSIAELIEYCSTFTPLFPGDVIVTGTPGGVGAKRNPPLFMKPGDTIEVEVGRLGILRNVVADEALQVAN